MVSIIGASLIAVKKTILYFFLFFSFHHAEMCTQYNVCI